MNARRERERRRPPSDRQYQFGSSQAALEADQALETNGSTTTVAAPAAVAPRPAAAARVAHKPFSAYRAEYAYVFGDLRRIAIVIGSLLLILLVLNFVLPH
jgi:hypothetical protein